MILIGGRFDTGQTRMVLAKYIEEYLALKGFNVDRVPDTWMDDDDRFNEEKFESIKFDTEIVIKTFEFKEFIDEDGEKIEQYVYEKRD